MHYPGATKRFGLHSGDSCYATGTILEQDQKYVDFLTEGMNSTQMYPMNDQACLAVFTAPQEWRCLWLAAMVAAYADQKGTYLATTVEFLEGLEGLKTVFLEWQARYMRLTEVGVQDMPLVNGMIS